MLEIIKTARIFANFSIPSYFETRRVATTIVTCNCKTEIILNHQQQIILLIRGLLNIIKRDSAQFQKVFGRIFKIQKVSQVNVLLLSIELRLKITVLLGESKILISSYNCVYFLIASKRFSSRNLQRFVLEKLLKTIPK